MKIKDIWAYLKGKKRIISILILISNAGIQAFLPGILTPEIHNWINLTGSVVGGVGIYDVMKQSNLKPSENKFSKS